ncbi:unnamed protein product [Prunus armeniaca]|nr:hypothetical protein GBA52_020147 [Prunus armeniaca]
MVGGQTSYTPFNGELSHEKLSLSKSQWQAKSWHAELCWSWLVSSYRPCGELNHGESSLRRSWWQGEH